MDCNSNHLVNGNEVAEAIDLRKRLKKVINDLLEECDNEGASLDDILAAARSHPESLQPMSTVPDVTYDVDDSSTSSSTSAIEDKDSEDMDQGSSLPPVEPAPQLQKVESSSSSEDEADGDGTFTFIKPYSDMTQQDSSNAPPASAVDSKSEDIVVGGNLACHEEDTGEPSPTLSDEGMHHETVDITAVNQEQTTVDLLGGLTPSEQMSQMEAVSSNTDTQEVSVDLLGGCYETQAAAEDVETGEPLVLADEMGQPTHLGLRETAEEPPVYFPSDIVLEAETIPESDPAFSVMNMSADDLTHQRAVTEMIVTDNAAEEGKSPISDGPQVTEDNETAQPEPSNVLFSFEDKSADMILKTPQQTAQDEGHMEETRHFSNEKEDFIQEEADPVTLGETKESNETLPLAESQHVDITTTEDANPPEIDVATCEKINDDNRPNADAGPELLMPAINLVPGSPFVPGQEEKPYEASVPVQEETPLEAPVPVPIQEEKPYEAPMPVQEEKPQEVPVPVQEEKLYEAPVPVQEENPFEAPIPVREETSYEASIPVQEETSHEASIPVQEEKPVEVPAEKPCQYEKTAEKLIDGEAPTEIRSSVKVTKEKENDKGKDASVLQKKKVDSQKAITGTTKPGLSSSPYKTTTSATRTGKPSAAPGGTKPAPGSVTSRSTPSRAPGTRTQPTSTAAKRPTSGTSGTTARRPLAGTAATTTGTTPTTRKTATPSTLTGKTNRPGGGKPAPASRASAPTTGPSATPRTRLTAPRQTPTTTPPAKKQVAGGVNERKPLSSRPVSSTTSRTPTTRSAASTPTSSTTSRKPLSSTTGPSATTLKPSINRPSSATTASTRPSATPRAAARPATGTKTTQPTVSSTRGVSSRPTVSRSTMTATKPSTTTTRANTSAAGRVTTTASTRQGTTTSSVGRSLGKKPLGSSGARKVPPSPSKTVSNVLSSKKTSTVPQQVSNGDTEALDTPPQEESQDAAKIDNNCDIARAEASRETEMPPVTPAGYTESAL